MKKRFITLALAILLVACMTVPALATGTTVTTPGGTGGTDLTYTVAQSFTVNIPAAVTLTSGEGTSSVTVVAGVLIPFGQALTVKVSSTQYSDGFRMKTSVENDFLSYVIKLNGTGEGLVNNATVLTIGEKNTSDTTATLNYTASEASKSGTYTDTLTFTVAVGAAS